MAPVSAALAAASSPIAAGLAPDKLAAMLDALAPAERLAAILRWGRATQAALFDDLAGFRPLSFEHFVPRSVPPMTEVVHEGKNTIPVFSTFAKVFCRPDDDTPELWGYNRFSWSRFTGPGYFVVVPTEVEGELGINYHRTPPRHPAGWPDIVPNNRRLGRVVYAPWIDIMRGLSTHVSVGRARRSKGFIDSWFVLCREDTAAALA